MNQSPQAHASVLSDAESELLDRMIAAGSAKPWLISYAQKNQISIGALIDSDVFGDLSDFEEDYPQATEQDKLYILKAYLLGESYGDFDVPSITAPLVGWSNNASERDVNLESTLYQAQRDGQENYGERLNFNTVSVLNRLDKIQIIKHIQRLNEQLDAPDQAITTWAQNTSQDIRTENLSQVQATLESARAYLGTSGRAGNPVSKYLHQWLNLAKLSFLFLKSAVMEAAELKRVPLISLGLFSLTSTVALGMLFTTPLRLMVKTAELIGELSELALKKITDFIRPNHSINAQTFKTSGRIIHLSLIIALVATNQVSVLMAFGYQIFPASWGWGFIGKLMVGSSVAAYAVGASFGVASAIYGRVKNLIASHDIPEDMVQSEDASVDSDLFNNDDLDLIEDDTFKRVQTRETSPSSHATPLDSTQRQALIRALSFQRMSVNQNTALSDDERRKQSVAINQEIQALFNQSKPYILTAYDKQLLKSRDKGIEGFEEHFDDRDNRLNTIGGFGQ